jgi:hypothetical protein
LPHLPEAGVPLTYSLRKNILYIVSVAMDQEVTRIAIVDIENEVVQKSGSYVLSMMDNPDLWEELANLISAQIRSLQSPLNSWLELVSVCRVL